MKKNLYKVQLNFKLTLENLPLCHGLVHSVDRMSHKWCLTFTFSFKGWFGLICNVMNNSSTTLPEPALCARYVFVKKHTTKIHFSGDSCVKQYVFLNLESTLIENISAYPDTSIMDCILAFLDPISHI